MKEKIGRLVNLGGSLAILIPKSLSRHLNLAPGDEIVKRWDGETRILQVEFVNPKLNSFDLLVQMEMKEK